MNPSKAIAVILVFALAASFAGLMLKQKNATIPALTSQPKPGSTIVRLVSHDLLSFSTSTNQLTISLANCESQVTFTETTTPILSNATRAEIYSFIQANPGVSFRGICSELGLSIGLAQFHLGVLTKSGLVSFFRDGKYKRFFEAKRFSKKEMKLISILRHETAGRILRALLERKQFSRNELAQELSITSQGLTWQINRLQKDKLIQDDKEGNKLTYSLPNNWFPTLRELASLTN